MKQTKSKKGMTSAMMIVGLFILVTIGVTVYYNFGTIGDISAKAGTDAPKEFAPINSFVTSCLKSLSKEALIKIGANGGYIDPLNPIYLGTSLYTKSNDPTESEVLVLSETSKLPYWHYMYTPNTCESCGTTEKNLPTFENMELQISKFIELNIDSCLESFEAFEKQQIHVQKLGNPEVKTTIAAEDVDILLTYTIKASKGKKEHTFEIFNAKQAISIPNIMTMALTVSSAEKENRFLEKITLNLIDTYSGLGENSLPPFSMEESGHRKKTWVIFDVEKNIKDMLKSYIPLITIENTANAQKVIGEKIVEQYVYNTLFLENDMEEFKDFEVRFHYWDWPIYLQIKPEAGGPILKPTVIKENKVDLGGLIPDRINNKYEFNYDLAFPVVVEVISKGGWDGEDYTLLFALEANIKKNKDILHYLKYGFFNWDPDKIFEVNAQSVQPVMPGTKADADNLDVENIDFDDFAENPQFAQTSQSSIDENTADMQFRAPAKNFMCDDEQKVGTELRLTLIDEITLEPVNEVQISYKCGQFSTCSVGETDVNGRLTTKLPVCYGGALTLYHEDYYIFPIMFDSTLDKSEAPMEVLLTKPYKKKFMIKALHINDSRNVDKDDNAAINQAIEEHAVLPSTIDENLEIQITLRRISENNYEMEYMVNKNFSVLEGIPIDKATGGGPEIEIVQGDYEVRIMYINHNQHETLESIECVDKCSVEGPWSEYKKIKSQELESYIQGYAEINEENILWIVGLDDLENSAKDTIVFYTMKIDMPEYTSDLTKMGKLFEYSKLDQYRKFIQPDFSSYSQELAIP
ncbi:hypothetical protein HN695_00240 [Candidatus Woesearchaeota archaeon]|jgi:hypothetical protein|nr:hypothetical protein [Candidatus Woesearchaeota archaeon]MBT5272551.1 hypothetical protein [Candidatus Woesearchaeota archaeon]MBT6041300.1 hypothetical protein [Candidatus Woesearchaeota archaeon]MBT6337103.1 hypothetical protein [Candidatus Woesearchaeota archaeon]MBT7926742.1 hypothetical protein [Candidatus Woesearchaeota archaeon]